VGKSNTNQESTKQESAGMEVEKKPKTKKTTAERKQVEVAASQSALSDEHILEMARAAKNREKFNKLWNADDLAYLKKHYPKKDDPNSVDWNRVDQALVNLLCFWTQDDTQVLRLWKLSKLNRDKLERNDYTERTIEKARESQTAFYSDGFVETVDIGRLVEIPPEYAAITENTKLQIRLKLIVQDAALLLDAIRLLLLYLGFTKNHSRLLNALIRKGRERLGVFPAKQSWLLEQYVNNGEKVSSEKTVSRDIHALLKEQEKLGVEAFVTGRGSKGAIEISKPFPAPRP
jgi:hypothetical protein